MTDTYEYGQRVRVTVDLEGHVIGWTREANRRIAIQTDDGVFREVDEEYVERTGQVIPLDIQPLTGVRVHPTQDDAA